MKSVNVIEEFITFRSEIIILLVETMKLELISNNFISKLNMI